MKLINFKTFYLWYQKVPINNKSREFQIFSSLYLSPQIEFDIDLSQDDDVNIFHFRINLLYLFQINITKNKKTDHAGFSFNVNIFGLNFNYKHYDIRHWNYDNDDWEKYDD
jgi:hypothetical protein